MGAEFWALATAKANSEMDATSSFFMWVLRCRCWRALGLLRVRSGESTLPTGCDGSEPDQAALTRPSLLPPSDPLIVRQRKRRPRASPVSNPPPASALSRAPGALLRCAPRSLMEALPSRSSRPRRQGAAPEKPPTKIPAEQLDSLVAPIALYPDPLLAQTLVASTYPLEIVQLQQWLGKNKELKDKALDRRGREAALGPEHPVDGGVPRRREAPRRRHPVDHRPWETPSSTSSPTSWTPSSG